MTDLLLSMEGIEKRFGAVVALGGVDLEVRRGEVHALVGENGAGKSTLMKVLSGAHAPDAGRMTLDGANYAPRRPLDALRAGVAMIYQELNLAPDLSVAQNLVLGRSGAEPASCAGTRASKRRSRCSTTPASSPTGPCASWARAPVSWSRSAARSWERRRWWCSTSPRRR